MPFLFSRRGPLFNSVVGILLDVKASLFESQVTVGVRPLKKGMRRTSSNAHSPLPYTDYEINGR
ncbi:hypothetical protein GQ600_13832 [Phytophthora cactorum]|nr:hypothetical protein GQ600_13832 [Phytophthora cactorum]